MQHWLGFLAVAMCACSTSKPAVVTLLASQYVTGCTAADQLDECGLDALLLLHNTVPKLGACNALVEACQIGTHCEALAKYSLQVWK